MYKLAVMAALVIAVSGKPEVHRLVNVQGEIEIPQDIVYDEEEQTVLITVAPVPKMTSLVPTMNFHDFKTGYVAFKDVNASKCYLSYPPIPFPSPLIYRMKTTHILRPSTARVSDNVMTQDDVHSRAGERIHDFCLDYDTYWMDLTPVMPPTRGKRDTSAPCASSAREKRAANVADNTWIICVVCKICKEESSSSNILSHWF